MKIPLRLLVAVIAFSLHTHVRLATADVPLDPQRVREFFRRAQAGEKPTEDEQRLLDVARRIGREGADCALFSYEGARCGVERCDGL